MLAKDVDENGRNHHKQKEGQSNLKDLLALGCTVWFKPY
jgi:hypothetical protein